MPPKKDDNRTLRDGAALVDRVSAENDIDVEQTPGEDAATVRGVELLTRQLKATDGELRNKIGALSRREDRIAEGAKRLAAEREQLSADQTAAKEDRAQLAADHARLSDDQALLEAGRAELAEAERELKARQIEADAGFAQANRESLSALEIERAAAVESLRDARRLHEERLVEMEAAHAQRLESQLERHLERLRQDRGACDADRAALDERDRALDAAEARVRRREAALVADAEALGETATQRAASAIAGIEVELEVERARTAALRDALQRSNDELRSAQHATRALGGRSDEDIESEIAELRGEMDRLRSELDDRPLPGVGERLAEVEAEREALTELAYGLRRRNGELETRLARTASAANELEAARDRVLTLESLLAGYRNELETARAEWDAITDAKATSTAFPSLAAIDEQGVDPEEVRTRDLDTLPAFIESLQQRMAVALEGRTLFYDAAELRVFVAGLAASRLHLLQGISGTGKTSLPLAFAAATGSGADVIEVQAGWRDRQDLLGFYNSFEKRFDERRMTQALYRAGSARFANRAFLIVLDEMNLSHPEQYFADFLSVLERDTDRVELMTAVAQNHPARFIDGRFLRVPRNVWFVGTANRDETTVAFADKTYDRAHVMELPSTPSPFEVRSMPETSAVSLSSLNRLFDDATVTHAMSSGRVVSYLDNELAPQLGKVFNVGWSHRLRRIADRFVPVMVAAHAGGKVLAEPEAADHLLATKVLRKLEGRFDVSARDFERLEELLLATWDTTFGSNVLPTKSSTALKREQQRLGG